MDMPLLVPLSLFAALLLTSCGSDEDGGRATKPHGLHQNELVMAPGQTIIAETSAGRIEIHARSWLERSYTWEGATRSVEMIPRNERWNGSRGLYFPGLARHWKQHGAVTRGVLEEGVQWFPSTEEAVTWLEGQSWMEFEHTKTGLTVGWRVLPSREQLNVSVWQLMVAGRKPHDLPGSRDAAVRLVEHQPR